MAAILDDDFQSYTIGDVLPLGSFTNAGAIIDTIVAGGPSGTTKCFRLFGAAQYDHLTGISGFSQFIAVNASAASGVVAFVNGPNSFNQFHTLVSIRIEADGTVSIVDPDGKVKNSFDNTCPFNTWNFFQINVTLTSEFNIPLGVFTVNIDVVVALNGVSIVGFSRLSSIPTANLMGSTAAVNIFQMNGDALFDAYTLDGLQPIVTYPHPGTPTCRINQGVIELAELPDSANVDVFQGAIELAQLPDDTQIWIHQGVIELLIGLGPCYISES